MPYAADYSYIGSGQIYIREYGASAPFVDIGNCSALTASPQEDVKTLADSTTPGGGTRNEVRRITGVDVSYTFTDFSPKNFERALRGMSSANTSGTVTDELVVAYKGGWTPLAKLPSSVTAVKNASSATTYTAGTDYIVQDGGLYIPTTSTIVDPVAGAANLKVTYANVASTVVEALVNSAKQYEMQFVGLNEARSGKRVRVRMHKVSAGVIQQMAVIGQDFGSGEVGGKLLADTTRGVGLSKYMQIEFED